MHLRLFLGLLAALVLCPRPGMAARLQCDPAQSRVEIVVKATVDSFTGRLEKFTADITAGADAHIATAHVHFRFADVKTGKEKRDRAMHDWQQTEQYPEGDFVLETLAPRSEGEWRARGKFTLHGQTRTLDFPVTIVTDHALCAIDGEATIDTREFGLPVIRMLGILKVEPEVRVRFHLQGTWEGTP
jgi:polyisoprenoid-binding protein YceI